MGESAAVTDIDLLVQTADFVVGYGFLAVGLVLFGLIAPAIYKIWNDKRISLVTACVGVAFIVAAGALDMVSRYAPSLISAQRFLIKGTVLGITDGFQVQLRSDLWRLGQAYVKRQFDAEDRSLYNFQFILITQDAPGCLALAIPSTDPNSDFSPVFDITPISADDLDSSIEIFARVIRETNGEMTLRVWRERDQKLEGEVQMLQPLGDTAEDCGRRREGSRIAFSFFSTAHAQARDTELWERLRSDDVFTRREARNDLSERGTGAFETIAELLDTDIYRLKLGGLVAFGGMSDEERQQAPAELRRKIRTFLNSSDETMREAAAAALK